MRHDKAKIDGFWLSIVTFVTICSAGVPEVVWAADPSADKAEVLDKTTIFGDRELPNVMYIVPWSRPELGDLVSKPVRSLLDQSITPLDRDVFLREIDYFETLHQQDVSASGGHSNH